MSGTVSNTTSKFDQFTPDSAAASLIQDERRRQIIDKRWTPEHDDLHQLEELALAAFVYAAPECRRTDDVLAEWPWDDSKPKFGDRLRELVKAGALIQAEIGRILRKKLSGFVEHSG